MKKATCIISIIVLSFFLATCGTITGTMNQRGRHVEPPSLVVLGDSISAGQYLPDISDAYPHLLAVDLHARLTVYAAPGHTAAQTRSMYTGELSSSYAVIELGTNDYKDNVPLTAFAATYQSIAGSISPAARVVCLSVWDPTTVAGAIWSSPSGIPSPVNSLGASPDAYNAIIRHSCHGTYLSVQLLYDTPAYHGNGSPGPLYHPDAAGDAAIARLVYAVFSSSQASHTT